LSNYAAATTTLAGGDKERKERRAVTTLTDVSDDVLNMLRKNIEAAAKSSTSCDDRVFNNTDVSIQKLDWFDFSNNDSENDRTNASSNNNGNNNNGSSNNTASTYDTIIASDCAYLRSQVKPLINTIANLLRKRDTDGSGHQGKLHMFAPYNRGVVYELIDELRNEKDMHVDVEDVDLTKYRIRQEHDDNSKREAFRALFEVATTCFEGLLMMSASAAADVTATSKRNGG